MLVILWFDLEVTHTVSSYSPWVLTKHTVKPTSKEFRKNDLGPVPRKRGKLNKVTHQNLLLDPSHSLASSCCLLYYFPVLVQI